MAGKLSRRELDRLADLGEGHTAAIEAGVRGNVEIKTALKIADVLGASLDWLVRGDGEPPSVEQVSAAVEAARKHKIHAEPTVDSTGTDG